MEGTTPDPHLEVLSRRERAAFRLVRAMNQQPWKRVWSLGARYVGANLIHLLTSNVVRAYGLEHVNRVVRDRPLLLVANHRTFWDLYVVTSVLLRQSPGWREIYFPVRGRFFYQTVAGLGLNALVAWWSMYRPFFHSPDKRRFDQYALGLLADLCREGQGRLVGFHLEGTRNKNPDPYSFLPPQPGVGRLIKEARPQVIPVFLAGLKPRLGAQVVGNWTRGEPVRIWFGPAFDYGSYLPLPDAGRTYRAISERLLGEIKALAEADRSRRSRGPE